MTISSALPIQFWQTTEETFQEQDICGKTSVCFCEFVKPGEQSIQINNGENSPTLKGYNEAGEEIDISASTGGSINGNYTVTFTISNDYIGQKIQLKAFDTSGTVERMKTGCLEVLGETTLQVSYPPDAGPNNWSQEGSDIAWTPSGESMVITIPDPGGDSNIVFINVEAPAGDYRVAYLGSISGSSTRSITFRMYNGGTLLHSRTFDPSLSLTIEDVTFAVPVTRMEFSATSSGGDTDFTVSGFVMNSIVTISNEDICYKTIRYSNHKNYAGIDYESGSPTPSFEIYISAQFFEEVFPLEEEVHPLSDDTWKRAWSRMEGKKLLEIGRVPFYMHKKIQMILMHDEVEIDGLFWVKRDQYSIDNGNKRFPLKLGSVLLTDRDFISRNLI